MTGKTFDTTLGKELALTDVLKGTQEEINQQIAATEANKRLFTGDQGTQKLYVLPIQKLYYDMHSLTTSKQ